MSALTQMLPPEVVWRLGWTLIHFIWEGAAIAGVAGVVLLLLRRRSASARYLAACSAFVLMPCVAIGTFIVLAPVPAGESEPAASFTAPQFDSQLSEQSALTSAGEAPMSAVAVRAPQSLELLPTADEPVHFAPGSEPAAARSEPLLQRIAGFCEPHLPLLVLGWGLGMLVLSLRLVGGWAQVQRLRRVATTPVGEELAGLLAGLAGRLAPRRPIRLLHSTLASVPMTIGWLRPLILLPVSAVTQLTEEQLRAILAHELAHIRRYDYLANLLQSVVEVLLFYHPCVWWLSRRIRTEREHCCDDLAVTCCRDRLVYARALAQMEELRGTSRLVAAVSGGRLLDRIRRITGHSPAPHHAAAGWLSAVMVFALVSTVGLRALSLEGADEPVQKGPLENSTRAATDDPGAALTRPLEDSGTDAAAPVMKVSLTASHNRGDHWMFIRFDGSQVSDYASDKTRAGLLEFFEEHPAGSGIWRQRSGIVRVAAMIASDLPGSEVLKGDLFYSATRNEFYLEAYSLSRSPATAEPLLYGPFSGLHLKGYIQVILAPGRLGTNPPDNPSQPAPPNDIERPRNAATRSAAGPGESGSPGLRLIARCDKGEIRPGELIRLSIELLNASDSVVRFFRPQNLDMDFVGGWRFRRQSDGKVFVPEVGPYQSGIGPGFQGELMELAPGERRLIARRDVLLFGSTLIEPGDYIATATYDQVGNKVPFEGTPERLKTIGGLWTGSMTSNEVVLHVQPRDYPFLELVTPGIVPGAGPYPVSLTVQNPTAAPLRLDGAFVLTIGGKPGNSARLRFAAQPDVARLAEGETFTLQVPANGSRTFQFDLADFPLEFLQQYTPSGGLRELPPGTVARLEDLRGGRVRVTFVDPNGQEPFPSGGRPRGNDSSAKPDETSTQDSLTRPAGLPRQWHGDRIAAQSATSTQPSSTQPADNASPSMVQVFQFRHAKAGDVAVNLQEAFRHDADIRHIRCSEVMNSLVVVGTREGIERLKAVVEELDRPPTLERVVRVVHLKHVPAELVVQVLRSLYPASDLKNSITAEPGPNSDTLLLSYDGSQEQRLMGLLQMLDQPGEPRTVATQPARSATPLPPRPARTRQEISEELDEVRDALNLLQNSRDPDRDAWTTPAVKALRARLTQLTEELASSAEYVGSGSHRALDARGMNGTWWFDNPQGDDEQMAIYPDGRIVVLYSNGHRDETRLVDGAVELAEYDNLETRLALLPDGTLLQRSDAARGLAKLWTRVDAKPRTELLRPLSDAPATAPATRPAEPAAAQPQGRLEFRIVPNGAGSSRLPALEPLVDYRGDLERNGPLAARQRGDAFAWFELGIPREGVNSPEALIASHAGRDYILLCNRKDSALLSGTDDQPPWSLSEVKATRSVGDWPAIDITLDAAGARLMEELTERHLDNMLTILVDDKVISAARLRSRISDRAQISGNFSPQQVREIVARLQAAVRAAPATRPAATQPTGGSAAPPGGSEIPQIVARLREYERVISNLELRAESRTFTAPYSNGPAGPPVLVETADVRHKRIGDSFIQQRTAWHSGDDQPFSRRTYNHDASQEIARSVTFFREQPEVPQAEISRSRHIGLQLDDYLFFLSGPVTGGHTAFSTYLLSHEQHLVYEGVEPGSQEIIIQIGEWYGPDGKPHGTRRVWIDPARDFLITRVELRWDRGNDWAERTAEVLDAGRIEGVWMPTSIRTTVRMSVSQDVIGISEARISGVSFGKVKADDLQVSFPPNAEVTDRIAGTAYQLGPDGRVVAGSRRQLPSEVSLPPAAQRDMLRGVIIRPDGRPAEGAQVCIAGEDSTLVHNGTRLIARSGNQVDTGRSSAKGEFAVGTVKRPFLLLVTHDTGYAELTDEEFAKSSRVELRAWGRIEGLARAGTKPCAGEKIVLTRHRGIVDTSLRMAFTGVAHTPRLELTSETSTDEEGRFVFERVPPVTVQVARLRATPDGGFSEVAGAGVAVQPGEAAQITIGGPGRTVTGRLLAPRGMHDAIDWARATGNARAQAAPLPLFPTKAQRHKWDEEFQQLPTFGMTVDREGRFRIGDVPDGTYELTAFVRLGEQSPDASSPVRIATAHHKFTVSSTDADPLDLREVQLKPQ